MIHTTYNTGTSIYTIYNSNTTTKVHYITDKTFLYNSSAYALPYLHYLQFNAITGATYNNTICITNSTKQYDTTSYTK